METSVSKKTLKGNHNMTHHDIHSHIVTEFENYLKEHEAWEEKGVKAAATRARKALGELGKLSKARRKEIQEKKNSM